MKRRHFVAAAAALAGIPVGAALAQKRGSRKLGNIGVQLYTLRQMMEKDVARTLDTVAKAGYKEVEFAGYFNVNPPVMKKLLAANGLVAPSAHIGMGDLGLKWDMMIDDANTLGLKYLTVAWIDAPEPVGVDVDLHVLDALAPPSTLARHSFRKSNPVARRNDSNGQPAFIRSPNAATSPARAIALNSSRDSSGRCPFSTTSQYICVFAQFRVRTPILSPLGSYPAALGPSA